MSEAVVEATEVESTEGEEKQRRGRPRPERTLTQDAQVLSVITEAGTPLTKEEIVAKTELGANQVYLSLWRLKNRDNTVQRVRDGGKHKWATSDYIAPEQPAEEPASE